MPGRDPIPTYERDPASTPALLDDGRVKTVSEDAAARVEDGDRRSPRAAPTPAPAEATEYVFA